MKKSLTALAVMAAVSVPFAAAQAGDMGAKIYGKIHTSIDYVDNKGDVSGLDAVHVSTNSSRLGVKGSADLTGGMKAVFQIESDIQIGDGVTGFGGRNTYAGVETMAGTVLMGKHDSPVKTISRKTDFFGDQIGDSRNILSKTAKFDNRPGEMVMYTTPSIAGANLAVQATLADTDDTGAAVDALGTIAAAATYKMGKDLYVGVGYEMDDADDAETVIRAGAKYTMGAISVAALFQMSTNEGGVKDSDRMAYGAGAAYKMGKSTFKAQYYGITDHDNATDSTGGLIAVGADHKLGDMTTAYVAFAMGMNGDTGSFAVSGGGHDSGKDTGGPAAPGDGPMGLSLGVVHKF